MEIQNRYKEELFHQEEIQAAKYVAQKGYSISILRGFQEGTSG